MGKSSKTVVIAARVPLAQDARLTNIAYLEGVTKTNIILRALNFYLGNIKKVVGINET